MTAGRLEVQYIDPVREEKVTPGAGIGWFLEALLCIAPFAKNPVAITLTGDCWSDSQPLVARQITETLMAQASPTRRQACALTR